jgi:hypothetical protein
MLFSSYIRCFGKKCLKIVRKSSVQGELPALKVLDRLAAFQNGVHGTLYFSLGVCAYLNENNIFHEPSEMAKIEIIG